MKTIRTAHGVILEKILHDNKNRYTLCWNGEGEDAAYDCACCITYVGDLEVGAGEMHDCGCICHERIEAMANAPHMKLFLLALEKFGEMPFVAKNFDDLWDNLSKGRYNHEAIRRRKDPEYQCECEDCRELYRMESMREGHESCECHLCLAYRRTHPPIPAPATFSIYAGGTLPL